jgi:hypothetical protein
MNGVPEEIAVSAYDLPTQPMSTVNRHDARLGGVSNLSTDMNSHPQTQMNRYNRLKSAGN